MGKYRQNYLSLCKPAKEYIEISDAIAENRELLGDSELGELAKEELSELEPELPRLEEEIKLAKVPSHQIQMMIRYIYLELREGRIR